jgi:hypothetical protein
MKKLNIVCSQSYNDSLVSAGLMLVVLFCFATVTAQAATPFDLVEDPHFWVEFSKDDKTVQKSTAFSEKEWVDPRLHVEDEIKYVFSETFFTNALAELPPITVKLDSTALKTELAVWLRKQLPESGDIKRITENVFNNQVKGNIERQIDALNNEANKMTQQPYETMSSGIISFSGPLARVLHQAKKLETGLAVASTRYYFPCDLNMGRWEMKRDPRGIHTNEIKASGKVQLKSIPIQLDELSGTTVGGFSPAQNSNSTTITIQPQAILTVTRTVRAGRGIKCDAKQTESVQKTFAPESLRYTAEFEAMHKEKE